MGIFSFLDPALNFIFSPLLSMSYFWGITIFAVIIGAIITLIYKYTTDQDLMKQLKGELKEFQKEIKELRHDPKKAMLVQKQMMGTNMKYMTQSFKPMLFTFIPIILIFGWMNAHLAFEPLTPGQQFVLTAAFNNGEASGDISLGEVPEGITLLSDKTQEIKANKAEWALEGEEGNYLLELKYEEKSFTKELKITNEKSYAPPLERVLGGESLKTLTLSNKPVKVINLFGWKIGWLGTYIIISIIVSMLLRKWMKVY